MPSEGLARNGLHLGALTSFAIAQQYFEPLADGPDFFIDRGATPLDLVLFALGFVIVPPALLLAAEALAGLARARAREVLHLAFVGGLAALIAWQAITGADPGARPLLAYAASVALGAGAAAAYARAEPVRSFLTLLGVAPVVVLALFLGLSPARTLAFGGGGPGPVKVPSNGAPVVLVVLDELPTASLMDVRGRIDAKRLPGFAALARESTWYRNAASPGDYTQLAVPTLLTGRRPRAGALQVASEHPDNLFTLLGAGHRLDVFEALTDICRTPCHRQIREPFARRMRGLVSATVEQIPALPPGVRGRLAGAVEPDGPPEAAGRTERVGDANVRRFVSTTQDVRFERFLDTLGGGRRPALNYLHLVLPHRPWRYLPDGRRYESSRSYRDGLFGRLPRDRRVVAIAWQRHLLQTAFVDRLITRLRRRLKASAAYDRSLVVVVADHGSAFRAGDHSRIVTATNVGEIAPVPLFVKAPRQRRGTVDDSAVETTDLLPTIARELAIELPWRVDGVEAGTRPRRESLTVRRQDDGGAVTVGRVRLKHLRDAAVRRRTATFRRGLFAIGPRRRLPGRPLSRVKRARGVRAVLDSPGRYAAVDPGARTLPVDVTGRIDGGTPRSRPVAVAVNGIVAATGWTITEGDHEHFTVLVPPSSLRRGRNEVEAVVLG